MYKNKEPRSPAVVLYYNTKTKLDLTKLFLLEVSQLQVQIYRK